MLPKRYDYSWLRRVLPVLKGLRELIPPGLEILRAFAAFVSSAADQAQQQYTDERIEDLAEHTEDLIGGLAEELGQFREHMQTVTEERFRAVRITGEHLDRWCKDLAEAAKEATADHKELGRQLAALSSSFDGLSKQLQEHDERVLRTIETQHDRTRRELGAPVRALADTVQAAARRAEVRPIDLGVSPPAPYLRDVSSLPDHWSGRQAEMDDLDAWLRSEDNPMYCLVAMGGTGKSTLSWAWLDRRVVPAREELGLEGIFQCSFYEGELSFELFLSQLTAYLELPPQDDPVTTLTQQLLGRRLLLVLDGFERLLQAYASADAALIPERTEDELEGWERCCWDSRVVRLLRGLLHEGATKMLLVSRLRPQELDGQTGYVETELPGLDPADAVAYLQARGIKGLPRELETEAERYGFHPVSLDRLVNALHHDSDLPDDIRAAHKWETKVAQDVKAIRHHVLERAYDTLPPEIGQFLSGLSALRQNPTMDIARHIAEDWPDTKLSEAIQRVEEDRWLKWDRETGTVEMHPLVRRYAYHRLEDKMATHNRLAEFFFGQVPPGDQNVEGLADLATIIELYHHTARAGRYDEACDLLYDRLYAPLYFRLGAYQTCIELLRELFTDGEAHPPPLENESAQTWTLNALADSYNLSGQPGGARPLYELAIRLSENAGDLSKGLEDLSDYELKLGELRAAECSLGHSIELCREIKDDFQEALGHRQLGRLLSYCGDFDGAAQEVDTATDAFLRIEYERGLCVAETYRAQRALLMGEPKAALWSARNALTLGRAAARQGDHVEREGIRVEWLLGWALVALAAEETDQQDELLTEAEEHLTEALNRCRAINMVDHKAEILLAWARWHRLKGNTEEARQHAVEALPIADRCEYRLQQADIHNFLARLALDAGARQAAMEHAETARERAECDGPPHYYKPAYEEAERLLTEAKLLPWEQAIHTVLLNGRNASP